MYYWKLKKQILLITSMVLLKHDNTFSIKTARWKKTQIYLNRNRTFMRLESVVWLIRIFKRFHCVIYSFFNKYLLLSTILKGTESYRSAVRSRAGMEKQIAGLRQVACSGDNLRNTITVSWLLPLDLPRDKPSHACDLLHRISTFFCSWHGNYP